MKLLNIGFGNLISADKILAVVSPDAAPVKRMINEAKEKGMLIDASCGRKTNSVIVMVTNHIVLSSATLKQIPTRLSGEEDTPNEYN